MPYNWRQVAQEDRGHVEPAHARQPPSRVGLGRQPCRRSHRGRFTAARNRGSARGRQTWHIHFRGSGDPLKLAQAAINVVKVTYTPLPQTQPSNPTSPLPTSQLANILGGGAMIGSNSVVTVSIPRVETIYVNNVGLRPETGPRRGQAEVAYLLYMV